MPRKEGKRAMTPRRKGAKPSGKPIRTFKAHSVEGYTKEKILHKFGLKELKPCGNITPIIRVLFTPSFKPEFCVTVEKENDAGQLRFNTLKGSLWEYINYESNKEIWPEVSGSESPPDHPAGISGKRPGSLLHCVG